MIRPGLCCLDSYIFFLSALFYVLCFVLFTEKYPFYVIRLSLTSYLQLHFASRSVHPFVMNCSAASRETLHSTPAFPKITSTLPPRTIQPEDKDAEVNFYRRKCFLFFSLKVKYLHASVSFFVFC